MEVIAEINNGIDVLGLSVGLDQDLVVVDFSIPNIDDTKITPRISVSIPDLVVRVILFGG